VGREVGRCGAAACLSIQDDQQSFPDPAPYGESAHAAHFLTWLGTLAKPVEDADGGALGAIDAELENCRRAWRIAARDGRADALRGAARVLLNYFDYRGRVEEGLGWLQHSVDAPIGRDDAALRARLLAQASHMQYRLARYDAAIASADDALEHAPTRDLDTRTQAHTVLASCALQQGRLEEARRHYTQALAITPRESLAHSTAATLDNLATVEKRLGHYDESLRLSNESLAQHRRLGDHAGVALCLNNLGTLAVARGETNVAIERFEAALRVQPQAPETHNNLANLLMERGDTSQAIEHYRRSLAIAPRNVVARTNLGIALTRMGRLQDARAEFEEALRIMPGYGPAAQNLDVLRRFGVRR